MSVLVYSGCLALNQAIISEYQAVSSQTTQTLNSFGQAAFLEVLIEASTLNMIQIRTTTQIITHITIILFLDIERRLFVKILFELFYKLLLFSRQVFIEKSILSVFFIFFYHIMDVSPRHFQVNRINVEMEVRMQSSAFEVYGSSFATKLQKGFF